MTPLSSPLAAAAVSHDHPEAGAPPLWSPGVAAALAFFFSPIFGAVINMKNWQAMGDEARARQSLIWIYCLIVYYAVLVLASLVLPETRAMEWSYRLAGFAVFIAWYVTSGKEQKDIVATRYGASFARRGWTKPVLLTIGIYLCILFVLAAIIEIALPGALSASE